MEHFILCRLAVPQVQAKLFIHCSYSRIAVLARKSLPDQHQASSVPAWRWKIIRSFRNSATVRHEDFQAGGPATNGYMRMYVHTHLYQGTGRRTMHRVLDSHVMFARHQTSGPDSLRGESNKWAREESGMPSKKAEEGRQNSTL